jgi:hypothetical protein
LETHLLNTGKQLPIWITSQYTYCKKGNCKCTKGFPHGPFYYLFYKEGRKIYHKYLPKGKFSQIEKFANTYKVYNERMAKLNKINKEIEKLLRINQKKQLIAYTKMDKREKEKVNWRYYTTDEYVKDKFLNKDFDTIETNDEVILMDYLLFYFT